MAAALVDDRIERWRTELPPEPVPAHHGPIARLYLAIYDLCRDILSDIRDSPRLELDKGMRKRFERCFSSLVLWSRDHDVAGGQLDLSLARSTDLYHLIVTFLANTCSILTKRMIPLAFPFRSGSPASQRMSEVAFARSEAIKIFKVDLNDEDEPIREATPSSDSLDRVLSNLITTIQGLVDLGPLLKDPFQDVDEPITHDIPETIKAQDPSVNLKLLIKHIFPKCREDVAAGVASASLENWRVLQQAKIDNQDEIYTQVPFQTEQRESNAAIKDAPFTDSGIGTSLRTGSSYAQTVRSYHGDSHRAVSIQLPPVPREGRGCKPFMCSICYKIIAVESQRAWKQHIMQDIKPYMCLESKCQEQFKPFKDKLSWTSHMKEHYAETSFSTTCPFCQISAAEFSFPGGHRLDGILRHISNHLEPIAAEVMVPEVSFASTKKETVDVSSDDGSFGSDVPELEDIIEGPSSVSGDHFGMFASMPPPAQPLRVMSALQRELLNGMRPIAPKPNLEIGPERLHSSRSRSHPRLYCHLCEDNPAGFRGEHELQRHHNAKHGISARKWKCCDPEDVGLKSKVEPVLPISECRSCVNGKLYNAYYNAAAHLRRRHFNPKTLRDAKKGASVTSTSNGNWPPMEDLKMWFQEVEVDFSHAAGELQSVAIARSRDLAEDEELVLL